MVSNVLMRWELFQKKFGKEKVAMIHGQMKDKEKDQIMSEFSAKNSKIQILVATTVIEVGIDVGDATIMIIENCEKFGLSQLHQLRGRVGRSDKKSYNILLYGNKIGINGKARLSIMKESNDGFKIAEEDMKMRGSGQILGTKQSGFPEYKIANLALDSDLLMIAGNQAKFLLNLDANLENEAARILLRLFDYDECVKLVQGG
jgi:ATP-dependent DNA helicase RecG